MKQYIPLLAASLAVTTPALLFTNPVKGDSKQGAGCPSMQLDQLHAHWQALVTEKDPDNRAHMINAHRKLVAQAKQTASAIGSGEVRDDCVLDAKRHHHDLGNMAAMHTMMLDMLER